MTWRAWVLAQNLFLESFVSDRFTQTAFARWASSTSAVQLLLRTSRRNWLLKAFRIRILFVRWRTAMVNTSHVASPSCFKIVYWCWRCLHFLLSLAIEGWWFLFEILGSSGQIGGWFWVWFETYSILIIIWIWNGSTLLSLPAFSFSTRNSLSIYIWPIWHQLFRNTFLLIVNQNWNVFGGVFHTNRTFWGVHQNCGFWGVCFVLFVLQEPILSLVETLHLILDLLRKKFLLVGQGGFRCILRVTPNYHCVLLWALFRIQNAFHSFLFFSSWNSNLVCNIRDFSNCDQIWIK